MGYFMVDDKELLPAYLLYPMQLGQDLAFLSEEVVLDYPKNIHL